MKHKKRRFICTAEDCDKSEDFTVIEQEDGILLFTCSRCGVRYQLMLMGDKWWWGKAE